MTVSYGLQAKRAEFIRDAVMSASPVRLLTMLYDRMLLDLNRAEAAQQAGNWRAASEQLIHAQSIVAELSGTLKVDEWEGGENLQAIYGYVLKAMVEANLQHSAAMTRECINLLEPLRDAWHEAAAQLPAQAPSAGTTSTGGTLGVG
ncbi:flagellar export chaperone FliS [Arthrobacter gandavensis]|uniref:Flagellar secretion chaperone FliS n=1 Tax=Arthrobacter gandavensis TaxID=169960 RepID=A0ABN2PFX2_9MICC|nr:flagellar export chaperone FliS [Arthrobacter citreus]